VIHNFLVVGRPVQAVFDYAAQFDLHPEWQPDLKGAEFEGAPAVGKTGFETLSGPMRPAGDGSDAPRSPTHRHPDRLENGVARIKAEIERDLVAGAFVRRGHKWSADRMAVTSLPRHQVGMKAMWNPDGEVARWAEVHSGDDGCLLRFEA
jgi:hypothetical protein